MKKLNNMKVQPRLILCFVLVVIMASLSGIVSTFLMTRMDTRYSKALVVNGFSQGDIGAFNTYLNKGSALVRDVIMLTSEEDIQNAQKELSDIDEKTSQYLERLKENCATEAELAYVKVIDEKYPVYLKLREEVVELGRQNHNDEALEMFIDQVRPVLNEAMQAANGLADLNVTLGNEVSSSLTAQSRVTIVFIVLIIAAAAVCSVVFAVYIARSFSEPIRQIQDASAKLSEGKLDIDIQVETLDEIGDMSRSFAGAAGLIRVYIDELSRGLKEIAAGNFNIECGVEFKGDFIELEQAIQQISISLSDTLKEINEASARWLSERFKWRRMLRIWRKEPRARPERWKN